MLMLLTKKISMLLTCKLMNVKFTQRSFPLHIQFENILNFSKNEHVSVNTCVYIKLR